jgi:RNA polymerase-binding protein DksA
VAKKKTTARKATKKARGPAKAARAGTKSATRKATSASRSAGTVKKKVRSSPTAKRKSTKARATAGTTTKAKVSKPRSDDGKPQTARQKSMLSSRDIEQFREMLLDKRAQLTRDVHTMRDEALRDSRQNAAGDLSSMPIHMADLGTDNYELEFTLGLIEGGRATLKEIDEALARIRNGTYGICMATGKPIGKARLKANPWAKYCYEYVLAQETGKQR